MNNYTSSPVYNASSIASQVAPKPGSLLEEAQQLLEKINQAIGSKKYAEALPYLPRLLFIASPTAEVWQRAAFVHQQLQNHPVARVFAHIAAAKSKRSVVSLRELFGVFYEQMDFAKAEKILQELLAREDLDSPTRAVCHTDYSVLARRFHNARRSVTEIELAAQYEHAHLKYFPFHRMFAYMSSQNWRQGMAYFEDRFGFDDFPIFSKQEFQTRVPRWDKLEKKNKEEDILFVVEEQGYGDVLQFVRFLPLIKDKVKHLVLAVPKPLFRLIEASPCAAGVKIVPVGVYPENMTAWLPIASLPHALADDLADKNGETQIPNSTPYLGFKDTGLLATTPLRQKASATKNGRKKIGLIWSSGPGAIDHQTRSLTLKDLVPLLALPNIDFYSLQLEGARKDIPKYGFQAVITDLVPWIKDFHTTAEVMQGLDLIISVDTAGVHLAAGLGLPTILLCSFESAWRFTIGDKGIDKHLDKEGNFHDMPPVVWYPKLKIIFKDNPYSWQVGIKKLVGMVDDIVKGKDNIPNYK